MAFTHDQVRKVVVDTNNGAWLERASATRDLEYFVLHQGEKKIAAAAQRRDGSVWDKTVLWWAIVEFGLASFWFTPSGSNTSGPYPGLHAPTDPKETAELKALFAAALCQWPLIDEAKIRSGRVRIGPTTFEAAQFI